VNVKYLIARAVKEFPNNTAIVFGDLSRTYRELDDRLNRLANGLCATGLQKGDRVGILLKNCPEYIEIDFALAKAGVVRVPLNARLTGADHVYMLRDSGAHALIFGSEFSRTIAEVRGDLPDVRQLITVGNENGGQSGLETIRYEDLILQSASKEPANEITETDLHTLFYTSGTTGKPKGAMLTQKAWAEVAINLVLNYGPYSERDVILNTQPLSHGAGFFVLPIFIRGGVNVLIADTKPRMIFETIERERVTVLKLVPTMLNHLVESPEREMFDFSSLHSIIYGGSPIAVPRLTKALEVFGARLIQLYGQAEAPMCISVFSRDDHAKYASTGRSSKLACAGKPCLNVEVRVVDENGQEVPDGEVGEIVVRGGHIMDGYWNLPDATAETLRDGWIFTGDMGYMDEEGYLFLVDRKKDVIISGAFNIYPKEIEDVIITHDKVKEVAVIGVPDDKWGEAVMALVVPEEEGAVTENDIIEHCRERMASFKKPKSVTFLKELPRNPYGKVQRGILREPYWAGYERKIH
jgi:acyl-CoA synthetase (AMP-forming)/AMP-acid ligase II